MNHMDHPAAAGVGLSGGLAMGNSLFDQLKKVGLVDEKRAKKIKSEKYAQQKQHAKGSAPPADDRKRSIQQSQAEKAEKDRELNRLRQEAAERKALAAQVAQLVEAHRIRETDGDITYHFVDGGKVKHLYVSPEIHKLLVSGAAVIIKLERRHAIVPREAADKIKERDPRCVLARDEAPRAPEQATDDPYAAYKVPDDLMW
jgi:uncharacterized protein YaiL (DUF2058 family)